jgi:LysR family transcriptional regulator for metE and metH
MRRVTLKHLRILRAVVRCGTVTGAAEEIAVTPPAVSLQLRQFEEIVGVALVERAAGGLRPTEAGREMLEASSRIESVLLDCGDAIELLRGLDGGRVAVGVISTAKYFAPRALAAFKKAHANVNIRVLVGNRQETIAALENFELDLAVMGRPPEHFEVEQTAIGPHPHVIIAPPDHPLAGKRLSLSDVSDETFLLREAGSGTRAVLQRLLADSGLDPTIGMEFGSNETIKQAVMAGMGIALLSAHTIAAEVHDRRLVVLDVIGLPIVRQWFVVRRREKRLLPAAQALWDHFATLGADYLPGGIRRVPE